ncbi:3,4-dihydroxy-2-butanone-4-phosphate synthase [Altericroceibacterium spongiae]|uniref:3,4-dihydroxy-2-butanone 4-phosphate synthase n=1 Tax=Altericroceibacterium spongiae TaxID=2320269 RepID=A0A420EJB8_9SPHN|nr:3,4-dihydroxy-2-butanone-4-phosphate synthase [Altericroceibacterium spongiae]RKF20805.1 3,4-dihydroxy-2-butanone-4-phosphate synthase [Altericroceibacterium spongiae]
MSQTIEKVRESITSGAISRSGLARAAGLHANTLRDCLEDSWNPTIETLNKLRAVLDANDERPVLAPIEEIIAEARNGRMYILVDDEDRENEGDLIIPGQMATPDAINFMATHGRGLICLALTSERCDALGLQPMVSNNRSRNETAFTVSIEAREGIDTGISAADRARTVSVAIDAAAGGDALVSPGHVFPLRAKDGGVLVRAGHTEAAVDISRLAGLNPSGVICEVMRDDGKMARLDDLIGFARKHDIKIATIRDLIAYRRRHDRMIEKRSESRFLSRWGGEWTAQSYFSKATGDETMALVKGRITPGKPTLVRMHALSFFEDVFGEETPRSRLLSRSMELIGQEGAGVVVVINRQSPGWMSRLMEARAQSGENQKIGVEELRDYGVGAQILAELNVRDMVLLTNTHHSLIGLSGYGLNIVGERPIE